MEGEILRENESEMEIRWMGEMGRRINLVGWWVNRGIDVVFFFFSPKIPQNTTKTKSHSPSSSRCLPPPPHLPQYPPIVCNIFQSHTAILSNSYDNIFQYHDKIFQSFFRIFTNFCTNIFCAFFPIFDKKFLSIGR